MEPQNSRDLEDRLQGWVEASGICPPSMATTCLQIQSSVGLPLKFPHCLIDTLSYRLIWGACACPNHFFMKSAHLVKLASS